MYRYDAFDRRFVRARAEEFRGQLARRLAGELTEEEFKPLRLMNGLYLQLHAYMLRVAIPYGVLAPRQMRQLARIARVWDRGFGHFTTRQNIQFNWIRLVDAPDILDALAGVEMHAIQTSGNCIRNVTTDPFAGAAHDEIADPRPWCEIIRQWSTGHPEFSFLPRKFKVAVTAAAEDRAATLFHDIGIRLVHGPGNEAGFRIFVGGGQGRAPCVARELRGFLEERYLLSYLEAVMRVYNLHGRRDNIHKARIKVLVNHLGIERFRAEVEAEWRKIGKRAFDLPGAEMRRIHAHFTAPDLAPGPFIDEDVARRRKSDPAFAAWLRNNVRAHKVPGHVIAIVSLKQPGRPPGDASAAEMEAIADLAERHCRDEIRITHTQNLVLPHVALSRLVELYDGLAEAGLAAANNGLVTDVIACPGLDYCNLANARSIPIADEIAKRFDDLDRQERIGPLRLNISGCINACGHHHAGHIGVLGVDKKGAEFYQITLGGNGGADASIGTIIGPGFSADEVPDAVEIVLSTYLAERREGETFLETWRRVGERPFKEALYGSR